MSVLTFLYRLDAYMTWLAILITLAVTALPIWSGNQSLTPFAKTTLQFLLYLRT